MKNKKRFTKIALYVTLSILSVGIAFPIIWMALMTIRPNAEVFKVPQTAWPDSFTMATYQRIFEDPKILRFFFNSYFIGIAVTLVSLFFGILGAYGFSRFRFKGKIVSNMFVVGTQTIPAITLLIPYYIVIVKFRLYNTYAGLILTYASFSLPYCMLMMISYFNTISKELDEAVIVDGGSRMYALWKIIVPIAKPGIISTAIYSFMLSWNEYLFASTLTKSDGMRTVPVGIALLQGENSTDWVLMMTMSVLGSIPVLLLYLLVQRSFIAGLSSGSVKG